MRRPGYLGEGVHAAPSLQKEPHTVGVDPFSSCVQSSQTFLKHTGEVWGWQEPKARTWGKRTPICQAPGLSELSTVLLLTTVNWFLWFPEPHTWFSHFEGHVVHSPLLHTRVHILLTLQAASLLLSVHSLLLQEAIPDRPGHWDFSHLLSIQPVYDFLVIPHASGPAKSGILCCCLAFPGGLVVQEHVPSS